MLILPRKKPELSKGLLVQSLFLDLRGGADLITQIVQFRAADTALTQNLEAGDTRGMDRENTLDALAVGDAAQRDRLGDAAAVTRNHNALEGLDTLFATFDNLHADFQRVANRELRNVGLQILTAQLLNQTHSRFLLFVVFHHCHLYSCSP